jgi:hypothetical protein
VSWIDLSIILFFVGLIEQALSEYQNLISVRLRIVKTTLFAELNLCIDFVVSVILFLLLYDFWDGIKGGAPDFKVLIPYVVYVQGCVTGTWAALTLFKKWEQKKLLKKNLANLKKARRTKKKAVVITDEFVKEQG